MVALLGAVTACSEEPRGEPEAVSLGGDPLFPPPLSGEARAEREAELEAARRTYDRDPTDVDAIIWLGRRTAYLGRYRDAIEIYSRGLRQHPDDPRLLRHRGHRFITTRHFALAHADLQRASQLIAGLPDQVEPDGLPNDRNVPTSTLHSNIWYHLGLVRYLTLDFEGAAEAYRRCLGVSKNPDMQCATSHWYYMTLRHLGREEEAAMLLEPITAELDVIENRGYHRLLLMYKGELEPEELLGDGGDDIQSATVAYGVGNWYLLTGREDEAVQLFEKIVAGPQWPAFGHIAAEVELQGR
jgi:hypothetical protein